MDTQGSSLLTYLSQSGKETLVDFGVDQRWIDQNHLALYNMIKGELPVRNLLGVSAKRARQYEGPDFDGLVQHVANSYPMLFHSLSKENLELLVDRFIRQVNEHYRQNEGRKAKRARLSKHSDKATSTDDNGQDNTMASLTDVEPGTGGRKYTLRTSTMQQSQLGTSYQNTPVTPQNNYRPNMGRSEQERPDTSTKNPPSRHELGSPPPIKVVVHRPVPEKDKPGKIAMIYWHELVEPQPTLNTWTPDKRFTFHIEDLSFTRFKEIIAEKRSIRFDEKIDGIYYGLCHDDSITGWLIDEKLNWYHAVLDAMEKGKDVFFEIKARPAVGATEERTAIRATGGNTGSVLGQGTAAQETLVAIIKGIIVAEGSVHNVAEKIVAALTAAVDATVEATVAQDTPGVVVEQGSATGIGAGSTAEGSAAAVNTAGIAMEGEDTVMDTDFGDEDLSEEEDVSEEE